MTAPGTTAAPEGDAARRRPLPPAPPPIGHVLRDLLQDLPGLIGDRIHLLALELKRARRALVGMLVMFLLAAILALTAWISTCVLVVAAAMRYGLPWDSACLIVLAINVVGVWLAVRHAGKLAGYLALPASMRQLSGASGAAAYANKTKFRG